ncbi:RabGAP/TBC [Aureobasidium pullulans]|uniref:GTPase-activating protein GYP7 n=1 Tax=Aureobasidium pullulans TaxID=5580 RepID=A0A4S8VH10_AURPU|nr:RabGAP/TBC [Aureobasidium pullulans]THW20501.1 RabGAP/TBC [Aureobasidium pullulans]THZ23761.1 RabGAP/TBC [Aureobasidium pullulans]
MAASRNSSPPASVYDMSDDEERDYNSVRRRSSSSRGVKLLYAKSKVFVHPSPSSKDNIDGFIALYEQKSPSSSSAPSSSSQISSSSLILGWSPVASLKSQGQLETYNKVDLDDKDAPTKNLVSPPPISSAHTTTPGPYPFAVQASEIYSIQVRPPSAGWWFGSLVINTRSGDSFPALFFHDSECQSTINHRKKLARENFDPFGESGNLFWGGDQVMQWLKRHLNVERSPEPNIFLVEPSDADRTGFGTNKSGKPTPDKVQQALEGPNAQPQKKKKEDPVAKFLKDSRWAVLEKLSQVTTFTRRTAQAAADNPKLPPQLRRIMQNPQVQTVQEEFDSARLYLARWAMTIAEQSERDRSQRIYTAKDLLENEDTELGEFEILDVDMRNLELNEKRDPVTKKEWNAFFDSHGKLHVTPDEVKERVFHGGLHPDDGVRKEAWLFLLGVHDWNSTRDERKAKMNSLNDEYIRLKGAWWDRMTDEDGTLEEREWWKEQKMRIEKDVHRTDRNIPLFAGEDIPHPDPTSPFAEVGTNVHLEQMKDMLLTYNEYNKDLGYVQGMSDLLAPIYAVMQDDAVAFWGFVNFMNRMERNFLRDQSGMRLQLTTLDHLVQLLDPKLYLHLQSVDSTNFFFFFRMLLVWYKREFEFPQVLRLWEGLWTDYLSANFHLFIAVAILEKHRDVIMEHLKGFDEVLKYVNELSNTIDLPSTLLRAEALFRRFQRTVEAIDRKDHFPTPTLRQRKAVTAGSLDSGPQGHDGKTAAVASSSSDAQGAGQAGTTTAAQKEKIVSPELRALLSREFARVEKPTKDDK